MEAYSGIFYGTRVPCIFFFFFLSLITPYLIFYNSSFTLKLDFEKIKLQKRGIFLISLEKDAECCIFCAKMAFAHFGPNHKFGDCNVLDRSWPVQGYIFFFFFFRGGSKSIC